MRHTQLAYTKCLLIKGSEKTPERSPVRILAPERTASTRKVAVVSRFSPEAQPKLQWPQAWPRPVLRGISPQCTPSRSRPAFRCEFALECSLIPDKTCTPLVTDRRLRPAVRPAGLPCPGVSRKIARLMLIADTYMTKCRYSGRGQQDKVFTLTGAVLKT